MKYLKVFLIAHFSFLFLSCIGDQNTNYPPTEIPKPQAETVDKILIGFEDFIILGELEKQIDARAANDESIQAECENWSFDLSALENILSKMEEVSPSEAFDLCLQSSCRYQGLISDNILTYYLIIHSKGHIVIKTEENGESLHFITKEAFEGHPFLGICEAANNK